MEEGIRARLARLEAEKRASNLRWFGVGLGLILLWISWRAHGRGRGWAPATALAAGAALAAGLLRPSLLESVYRPWMRAAGVLAKINTYLILGGLYYLVITPYARLAALFGADGLDDSRPGAPTYWKKREGLPPKESYRRQF